MYDPNQSSDGPVMAPQIFRHDNQPTSDLDLNVPGSSILRSGREAVGSPAGTSDLSKRQTMGVRAADSPVISRAGTRREFAPLSTAAATNELPPVILQLPDLSADSDSGSGRMFDLSSLLSWVGIGLGAAVAVALIWSGPNVARPDVEHDEAPAWSTTEPGSNATGSQVTTPATKAGEATRPAGETESPAPDGGGARGGRSRPRRHSMQATTATPSEAPVLTARGTDTTWDGSVSLARPGEAAPVGRIMNVTVPQ